MQFSEMVVARSGGTALKSFAEATVGICIIIFILLITTPFALAFWLWRSLLRLPAAVGDIIESIFG